jgi:hypothetical protein
MQIICYDNGTNQVHSTVSSFWGISGHDGMSTFTPIPELQVSNSDISLVGLSSKVIYAEKVLDPWFQATQTSNKNLVGSTIDFINYYQPFPGANVSYFPDRLLSILGCVEQYEFCDNLKCSGLGGLYANNSSPYLGLTLNENQKAAFNLIWNSAWAMTLAEGLRFIPSGQLLLAQQSIWFYDDALSNALPKDQWKAEVVNLMGIMMAALQRRVVDFVSAPNIEVYTSEGIVSSQDFVPPLENAAAEKMCGIIRVRNASYFNFSVVGLAVLICGGLLIIIWSTFCLPEAVFRFQRRRKGKEDAYSHREWTESHLLRLHKTVLDDSGFGPWKSAKAKGSIPVLEKSGLLFSLDEVWRRKEDGIELPKIDSDIHSKDDSSMETRLLETS